MRIGSHPFGCATGHLLGSLEETLAAIMSRLIDNIESTKLPSPKGYPVYGTIQVAPLTTHPDVCFVYIPRPGSASHSGFTFTP